MFSRIVPSNLPWRPFSELIENPIENVSFLLRLKDNLLDLETYCVHKGVPNKDTLWFQNLQNGQHSFHYPDWGRVKYSHFLAIGKIESNGFCTPDESLPWTDKRSTVKNMLYALERKPSLEDKIYKYQKEGRHEQWIPANGYGVQFLKERIERFLPIGKELQRNL